MSVLRDAAEKAVNFLSKEGFLFNEETRYLHAALEYERVPLSVEAIWQLIEEDPHFNMTAGALSILLSEIPDREVATEMFKLHIIGIIRLIERAHGIE
jgi:hypothetical protein